MSKRKETAPPPVRAATALRVAMESHAKCSLLMASLDSFFSVVMDHPNITVEQIRNASLIVKENYLEARRAMGYDLD